MPNNLPRLALLSTCLCWLLACIWLAPPQPGLHALASSVQLAASPSPTQIVTPAPSPSPTPSPSPSPTPSPTPSPLPSPSPSPLPTPSPSPTLTPTATATPTTIGSTDTTPSNGSKTTGTILAIVLGLAGLLLTVLGMILYSFYARQQRIAQGR